MKQFSLQIFQHTSYLSHTHDIRHHRELLGKNDMFKKKDQKLHVRDFWLPAYYMYMYIRRNFFLSFTFWLAQRGCGAMRCSRKIPFIFRLLIYHFSLSHQLQQLQLQLQPEEYYNNKIKYNVSVFYTEKIEENWRKIRKILIHMRTTYINFVIWIWIFSSFYIFITRCKLIWMSKAVCMWLSVCVISLTISKSEM